MHENELISMVERLWRTTLRLPLRRLPDVSAAFSGEPTLTASIRLGGRAPAVLSLTCQYPFARTVTGAMLNVKPESPSREELRDAVGEIVNIVGGNLKAAYEPSARLGLPEVHEGDVPPGLLVGGAAEILAELAFESAGQRFILRFARHV